MPDEDTEISMGKVKLGGYGDFTGFTKIADYTNPAVPKEERTLTFDPAQVGEFLVIRSNDPTRKLFLSYVEVY